MSNLINNLMPEEITRHYAFIRFREPNKFRDGYISRLSEFTNYDALVAANNSIINVDIRSYCFDHVRVREELYRFTNKVSSSLWARCKPLLTPHSISTTDNNAVGGMAQEPIHEVTYVIEILK